MEINIQLLQQAALRATIDAEVMIQTATEQPAEDNTMSQVDAKALPRFPCPLCLKVIESFQALNPNQRMKLQLCQECGKNPRMIRCSTCNSELCEQCDADIHKFSTMRSHVRTPTANGGNMNSYDVELQCQSLHHRATMAAAFLKGTVDSQIRHPLYAENNTAAAAEFYCKDDSTLICKYCRQSEHYQQKNVVSLLEGSELRVKQLRNEGDKCRQLTNELRQLIQKYDECTKLDDNLFHLSIAELKTARDAVVGLVNSKFQEMEDSAAKVLANRESTTKYQKESLLKVIGQMADVVIAAEKHMVQR